MKIKFSNSGFSLVEVLIVLILLSGGFIILLQALITGKFMNAKAEGLTQQAVLLNNKIQEIRSRRFDEKTSSPWSSTLGTDSDAYLSFDGANDYVLATGYKGITGTAARSIGVWINTSASGMIVNWGANSPGQRFGIRVNINQYGNNGALKAEVNSGYTTGTTDLRDGNWHYIVVTAASNISANQFNLYVDGALETVSSSMSRTMNTANSLDVSVGSYTGSSNFFNGNMDKFSIWNKQLTASEITALYNSGNGIYATSNSGNYTSSSNLVVYWKMNEGSGSTLTDLGGNNNGTINGATWGSSQPSSESTISGWDDIDDFNLYSVSEIPNYTAFGYSVKVHYVQSSSGFHSAITGPSDYKRVMVEINHKTLPALRDTFIVSPGL